MLNSIISEVQFEDGHVKEYNANTITENIITQVDSDAFTLNMMDGIIDYQKDTATAPTKDNKYIVTKCGQKKIQKTRVGWELLVQWRDQSESWIQLKDLRESHTIEVSKFAKA